MKRLINGIQQAGIGVEEVCVAFDWYKKYFGFNTVVFENVAEASLMHRYTGGQVYQRYAVLAMNMQGGGGLEIWQYTSRKPKAPKEKIMLGDLGIFAIKIKCKNVAALYQLYKKEKVHIASSIAVNPVGEKHFFIRDPFDNLFQLIEDDYWFHDKKRLTGGVCGAIIGVSNMQSANRFYRDILDYKTVTFQGNKQFEDLYELPGGNKKTHRTILKNTPSFQGAFSKLLGPTTIELIEIKTEGVKKIFEGRYWGDLGFIHVCYDICSMQMHQNICASYGSPLTVNSGDSFEMGQAAGQFAYNEDPDGTLIEYVETHKVPILKKLGLYLDLRKRKNNKALPDWIVKCMGFSKQSLKISLKNSTAKGLIAEKNIQTIKSKTA